jgi:hypothetical protein
MEEEARRVYPLYHLKIGPDVDKLSVDPEDPAVGQKRVGVYSTERKAEEAIERLRPKPGFRDWPGGFRVLCSVVDRIAAWEEGFISWDEASEGL